MHSTYDAETKRTTSEPRGRLDCRNPTMTLPSIAVSSGPSIKFLNWFFNQFSCPRCYINSKPSSRTPTSCTHPTPYRPPAAAVAAVAAVTPPWYRDHHHFTVATAARLFTSSPPPSSKSGTRNFSDRDGRSLFALASPPRGGMLDFWRDRHPDRGAADGALPVLLGGYRRPDHRCHRLRLVGGALVGSAVPDRVAGLCGSPVPDGFAAFYGFKDPA